jgi:hypothetical protein
MIQYGVDGEALDRGRSIYARREHVMLSDAIEETWALFIPFDRSWNFPETPDEVMLCNAIGAYLAGVAHLERQQWKINDNARQIAANEHRIAALRAAQKPHPFGPA